MSSDRERTPSTPPKYPLFTTDFFSTKSFGPGHIVGAVALVFGVVGLAKLFIGLGKEEAERALRPVVIHSPPDAPKIENARGRYGRTSP